jgi:hypothetical protein
MAVDRAMQGVELADCREALINACVDGLVAIIGRNSFFFVLFFETFFVSFWSFFYHQNFAVLFIILTACVDGQIAIRNNFFLFLKQKKTWQFFWIFIKKNIFDCGYFFGFCINLLAFFCVA